MLEAGKGKASRNRLAPVGADLAGVSGTDDAGSTDPADMAVAAGTDDAGTTSHPTDMASKPPAPSASLPGCSVGGDGAMFSLFALLLAVAVIPSLQRARRRR